VTDKRSPEELLKERQRLLAKVVTQQQNLEKLNLDKLLHPKQLEFANDPAQFRVACCSRQSGKSHCCAILALRAAIEVPGSTPTYINMNRGSAQYIIWPPLMELNEEYDLGLEFIKTTSDIRLPNGSTIKVFGAGSLREMDKIRGIGSTLNLVVLDEAQNFGSDMYKLIREILLPATVTHKAPILITGTPSAACAGPYYDIVHGGGEMFKDETGDQLMGWSQHSWLMKDNPFIPDVEEQYRVHKAANNWTDASPAFRREYLGEWVRDTEGLCYYNKQSMVVDRFPLERAHDWRYILGVDVGTKDPWAFTMLATSRDVQATYVLESIEERLTTLEAGDRVGDFLDQYPCHTVIVDTGGQGAAPVAQWKDTHPLLPIQPVKKGYGSVDMGIQIINADIKADRLFFVKEPTSVLRTQMATLIWDAKASPTGARRVKRGDGYPDHCADSFRYAYTKVRTWRAAEYGQGVMMGEDYMRRKAAEVKREIMAEKGDEDRPFWQRLIKK
jgi:hypothetical protein